MRHRDSVVRIRLEVDDYPRHVVPVGRRVRSGLPSTVHWTPTSQYIPRPVEGQTLVKRISFGGRITGRGREGRTLDRWSPPFRRNSDVRTSSLRPGTTLPFTRTCRMNSGRGPDHGEVRSLGSIGSHPDHSQCQEACTGPSTRSHWVGVFHTTFGPLKTLVSLRESTIRPRRVVSVLPPLGSGLGR